MGFTLAKLSPDNCTSKEVPRSTHILRTFEAAKNHWNFVSSNTFQYHVWEYMLSLLKASIGWALSKALSYHSNHFLLSKWMCLNGFSLFFVMNWFVMRNFCNLIGLEQWYFSLIWNTYMWKLQTFCGWWYKQTIAWFVVIFGINTTRDISKLSQISLA